MFNAAAAISLALCIFSVGAMIRSHFVFDALTYLKYSPGRWHDQAGSVFWSNGLIGVEWGDNTAWYLTQGFNYERREFPTDVGAVPRSIIRFSAYGLLILRNPEFPRYWEIATPCWLLALLTLATPAIWIMRFIVRRRQMRPGHCACGYDLRSNVSGVCPECGKLIGNVVQAK
jgi:hypothetical protein